LIRFFKDRLVWLVQPDEHPAKLSPYSNQEQAALTQQRPQ